MNKVTKNINSIFMSHHLQPQKLILKNKTNNNKIGNFPHIIFALINHNSPTRCQRPEENFFIQN